MMLRPLLMMALIDATLQVHFYLVDDNSTCTFNTDTNVSLPFTVKTPNMKILTFPLVNNEKKLLAPLLFAHTSTSFEIHALGVSSNGTIRDAHLMPNTVISQQCNFELEGPQDIRAAPRLLSYDDPGVIIVGVFFWNRNSSSLCNMTITLSSVGANFRMSTLQLTTPQNQAARQIDINVLAYCVFPQPKLVSLKWYVNQEIYNHTVVLYTLLETWETAPIYCEFCYRPGTTLHCGIPDPNFDEKYYITTYPPGNITHVVTIGIHSRKDDDILYPIPRSNLTFQTLDGHVIYYQDYNAVPSPASITDGVFMDTQNGLQFVPIGGDATDYVYPEIKTESRSSGRAPWCVVLLLCALIMTFMI